MDAHSVRLGRNFDSGRRRTLLCRSRNGRAALHRLPAHPANFDALLTHLLPYRHAHHAVDSLLRGGFRWRFPGASTGPRSRGRAAALAALLPALGAAFCTRVDAGAAAFTAALPLATVASASRATWSSSSAALSRMRATSVPSDCRSSQPPVRDLHSADQSAKLLRKREQLLLDGLPRRIRRLRSIACRCLTYCH